MSCIFAILPFAGQAIDGLVDRAVRALPGHDADRYGLWTDPATGAVLGQTRLGVQDPGPAGKLPMVSASERFVLAFNGEIYNQRELRAQLAAEAAEGASIAWRGHADTETVLACVERWGLKKTLGRIDGMFAFVLWDRERRELACVRDRSGEKPLYYGLVDQNLVVVSGVRGFAAMQGAMPPIERRAVSLLMRFGAIPAPLAIYKGVYKLAAGHCVEFGLDALRKEALPAPQLWWNASELAHDYASRQRDFSSDDAAIAALHDCLGGAVRRQMIADVPLGGFLSGGVDSSLVAALMQAEVRRNGGDAVRTFSIGFHERSFDEAPLARRVAEYLQTRHTELYVSDSEALAIVPQLPLIYDEPFADSSQVGACLAIQMAAGHVSVALAGDGGDEIFGGYNRYAHAASLWRRLERLPLGLRRRVADMCTSSPGRMLARSADRAGSVLPPRMRPPQLGERVEKLARMLASHNARDMYLGLVEYWNPDDVMLHGVEPFDFVDDGWPALPTLEEQMMLLDYLFVLPTDMLPKVERPATAAGLETRLPFLDRSVVEFAWQLPIRYKVREGQGKWLVKQLLYRLVPRELVERPKMGFESPVGRWLCGPLREWAEELLDRKRLEQQGWFRAPAVRQTWDQHLSGRENNAGRLWSVLMFQAWLDARQREHGLV